MKNGGSQRKVDWLKEKQAAYEQAKKTLAEAEVALALAAIEIHRVYDIDMVEENGFIS